MGDIGTVFDASFVADLMQLIFDILSWGVITFIIVALVGFFFAERVIKLVRNVTSGGSSSAPQSDYQKDNMSAFLPFFFFQPPDLDLPDIDDSYITDFVGQLISWGPIQFLLIAMVAAAVLGVVLKRILKAVGGD